MDGYQSLANAIVAQAAEDYRVALVEQHRVEESEDTKVKERAKANVEKLEAFFTGKRIKLLTKLDGPELMNAIKAEVIEFNYDLKALEDSHNSAK